MSEANITIDAVEIIPNPVETGKHVIIRATVTPKIYSIDTESSFPIMTADGFIIERTE